MGRWKFQGRGASEEFEVNVVVTAVEENRP